MRLLDLCCKAGGAAVGYHRAGFEVVGVDIEPQPNYPFPMYLGDAMYALWHLMKGEYLTFAIPGGPHLTYRLGEFDAIHASWPCQKFSAMTKRWKGRSEAHPDLIGPGRELIQRTGKPYVIENVPGAPLINPIMLCGTMFKLETAQGNQLRRHRLFECSFDVGMVPPCAHNTASVIGVHGGGQHPNRRRTIGVYGNAGGSSRRDGVSFFGIEARKEVMGIDWMTGSELNQAIPPAYTQWIGERLYRVIEDEFAKQVPPDPLAWFRRKPKEVI